jgi:hypothetical protein
VGRKTTGATGDSQKESELSVRMIAKTNNNRSHKKD